MWEVLVQFGIVDTDLNGGAPIARFRDTLGAMAAGVAAGQGALSSSSLLYDFESVRIRRDECACSSHIEMQRLLS